jgi:hypothetical protein
MLILDIFRPFAGQRLRLHTFTYHESTVEDVIYSSLQQLKQHLVTFPQHHPVASRQSILWYLAAMYVANAVVATPHQPNFKQYFFLCVAAPANLS